MNELKQIYQHWIKDEVESPEVQNGRETFLANHFQAKPTPIWGWARSPAFGFAMAAALAIVVVLKVNPIQNSGSSEPIITLEKEAPTVAAEPPIIAIEQNNVAEEESTDLASIPEPGVRINKLASQVGPTVAYQKDFSDVQVTVLWVLTK